MAAIAITGATGFLGGALSRRLLAEGQPVIALGRDAVKLATLEALGARCIAHDLGSGAPPEPDRPVAAVVHCAGLSSNWGDRAAFQAANVDGTRAALTFASDAGAARFIHISTPSLYFRFRDQPLVREDAVLPPPVNAYAATKSEAEKLVLEQTGLDPVILRPRGLYGSGDAALLPRLLRAARSGPLPLIRNGRAETDLTHIDDVVDAVLAALAVPAFSGRRIFNVSGGEPLPVRRIAEAAGACAGVSVRWRSMPSGAVLAAASLIELAARLRPGKPEPRVTAYSAGLFAFTQTLDISAARTHLGWAPAISFEEGLARTFRPRT
ncbi:MAG: NAD(P)-dependent oxidoreductase [Hyphomonas sp.]|uniref:NAD-dependent epimerase/dehydratase family protein n=1 Tax=Hyphomonas sp. TaxID=87 RepID=UPI00179DEB12|nr:NAD(P)-dependent oxidoreductase [Hyphomonas sp.]MBU3921424.1 NAD(P)-dependent oxidoreductase [Alphaproteobacteria bacterium]MBA3069006.1 NAD(P)-dependent oxidoreductase [Hyphomonas sp.]MBU4061639.1 NAD(P)-dependent oxidoreductase [Alphaproteobacteria bacterium]MBU4163484.1 NAD(P)-dependent oxidoreductase [Alphaproteobacteria bacterium]MBU4569007.1 NAD(P)-dependent oxidoreductase [Alphaproteobacteria bacterium]